MPIRRSQAYVYFYIVFGQGPIFTDLIHAEQIVGRNWAYFTTLFQERACLIWRSQVYVYFYIVFGQGPIFTDLILAEQIVGRNCPYLITLLQDGRASSGDLKRMCTDTSFSVRKLTLLI